MKKPTPKNCHGIALHEMLLENNCRISCNILPQMQSQLDDICGEGEVKFFIFFATQRLC